MKKPIQQVKFNNNRKESHFDFVRLEELFTRKDLPHSLTEFQQIDFYLLVFFTKGTGKHTVDFIDYTFKKGTILSVRKDQIHKFNQTKDAEGFMLLFTDTFLLQFIHKNEVFKNLQLFNELITSPKLEINNKDFASINTQAEEMATEYFSENDDFSMGIIASLLNSLILKLYRIKTLDHQFHVNKKYVNEFIQLQSLVEQQCFQTKKVSDFASQMTVSTKTLNNITNTIISKSAKQFIDDILIIQIKRLLINTSLSVKEIAFQAGFEEPTNLYKFFKKNTQQTPEVFRKSTQ